MDDNENNRDVLHRLSSQSNLVGTVPPVRVAPAQGVIQDNSLMDQAIVAGMFYLTVAFLSLCFLHHAVKFLLRNPLMLLFVAPILRHVFKGMDGLFKWGNDWVWESGE